MAGTLPDELLLARIRKESEARAAAVSALYAALESATAEMQQKITVAASRLSAQIGDRTVNASAIAGQILRTQVEPGFALAEELTLLEARVTDGFNTSAASIEELRTTTATQFESQAQQTLTIRAQFNGSVAYLQDQITANATATSALATRTTTLEASVNNPTTGLSATYARIVTEETVRASADSALSSRTTTLESSVNNPTTGLSATYSRIVTEESTRASADSALSSRTSTLETQVQTPTTGLLSRVSTVESTKVDAAGALAQANSAITASLTSSSAGTIGAAINTEASARATADGNLSGKYSLKVTAGNVVTGMNITSSTGSGTDVSDVTFQASSFKVYNGSTGVAPFQVVGGVVKVTGSLVISSGDVSGLGTLATQNTVTTGQVTGLGGLATKSSVDLSTSDVTNKSLANVDSTANTKLAGIAAGADVTLTAISGGLTIYSGGLTLSGTPSIQSSNYVAGSAGWAIKGDGSVEFSSGTFRGTLDVGSADNRTYITSSGLSVGNTSAGIVLNGSSSTNYINIGSGRNYTLAMSGGTSTGALSLTGPGFSMGMSPLGYMTVYGSSHGTSYYRADGYTGPYGSVLVDGSGRWAMTAGSGRSIVFNTNGTDRFFVGSDGHFKTAGGDIRKVSSDGWTPPLMDGSNTIAFQWDGSNFKVKIGVTVFTIF